MVFGLKEGLVECATVWVKSEVILRCHNEPAKFTHPFNRVVLISKILTKQEGMLAKVYHGLFLKFLPSKYAVVCREEDFSELPFRNKVDDEN